MSKTSLIIGVSGQDGPYLAGLLLDKGRTVHGTSRDAEAHNFENLALLGLREKVSYHSLVPTDFKSIIGVIEAVKPDEIYNLSGLSSVGLSFKHPVDTLEGIILGTLNILEAIRMTNSKIRFYNAASSECFGDTTKAPAIETAPFRPKSPYAIAKATAFWEVANYRESYGLDARSGILFNHESPLRPVRFVTQKVVRAAAAIAEGDQDKLIMGNLSIKRDWGWAPEYMEAVWKIMAADTADDFIVATGKAYSLEDFVRIVFEYFGLDWQNHVEMNDEFIRPSDLDCCHGNPSYAEKKLGWKAKTAMPDVAKKMCQAEEFRRKGNRNWAFST